MAAPGGPVVLRLASTMHELQQIFAVRAIVFMQEQDCPFDEEFDQFDVMPESSADMINADTVHVLGLADREPVACARLRFLDKSTSASTIPTAKFERIAIREQWRGNGVGHELVRFLMQAAHERGFERFILNAQSHLTGFYGAHGFSVSGDNFIEAGIDHAPMTRNPDV